MLAVKVGDAPTVRVLSYGVGTKVASLASIVGDVDGLVLRDSHAEVLARRGLVRLCYDRLLAGRAGRPLSADEKLVLYTSSTPCGNATVRKWARSSRDEPRSDEAAWNRRHLPLQILDAAQVTLLTKKHPGDNGDACDAPPGCTLPRLRQASHTCSDKIARWVALGAQGALLARWVGRLAVEGVAIGRKYSFEHARRALCCRLPMCRHLALMGTNVKLDDGIYENGCGATFGEMCFAWWETASRVEALDGRIGMRLDTTPSLLSKHAFFEAYSRLDRLDGSVTYAVAKMRAEPTWHRLARSELFSDGTAKKISRPFASWMTADPELEQFVIPSTHRPFRRRAFLVALVGILAIFKGAKVLFLRHRVCLSVPRAPVP